MHDPPHLAPLAERMRPRRFEDLVGQARLFGAAGLFPRLLESGRPPSLILWGPPGSGKTTVARLVAARLGLEPVVMSAVTAGVRELKACADAARSRIADGGGPTLLFVDEIHRFNRTQQDSFLGPVEDGTLILLGATTENPSFQLNAALLSRCRVVPFEPLSREALGTLLDRALRDHEAGLGADELELEKDLRELLLDVSGGDARALLTDLEWIAAGRRQSSACGPVSRAEAEGFLARLPRYDRAGEEHFNTVSALHKSLRASDVQASLYWLARMLEGGEDPLYVARRLVRFASEDVGAADPQALVLAVAARDAVHFLGLPEGKLALAELVVVLATAPKSNRVDVAYRAAALEVERRGALPVPLAIRNAPTALLRDLGYGAGYRSPHEDESGHALEFLPDELRGARFYTPRTVGFEREVERRMAYYARVRGEGRRGQPRSDMPTGAIAEREGVDDATPGASAPA